MKKLIIIIALSLALSGCLSTGQNLVIGWSSIVGSLVISGLLDHSDKDKNADTED